MADKERDSTSCGGGGGGGGMYAREFLDKHYYFYILVLNKITCILHTVLCTAPMCWNRVLNRCM